VYQTDWLLRQIEQMGDVIRRLIAALREHRPEDAIQLSREAVRELLDDDSGVIESLSGDGLVALFSAGGALDTFRAHMLAELLVARAEAHVMRGETERGAAERERARVLLQAVLPMVEGTEAERVRELLGWIEG